MFGLFGKKMNNKNDGKKDGKKDKEKDWNEWTELMYMDALMDDEDKDE